MVSEVAAVAPQTLEVPMVEAVAVRPMRDLGARDRMVARSESRANWA
jgi:hypothetical protein